MSQGAALDGNVSLFLSEESIYMKRPVWHVTCAIKRFNLTIFYHDKKKKKLHRLKNSVKLPQNRIIPSSAIKFNRLVSCVWNTHGSVPSSRPYPCNQVRKEPIKTIQTIKTHTQKAEAKQSNI